MAVGAAGGPDFHAGLLADRWNGGAWSVRPVPKPRGAQSGDLAGVSCTSPSACTVSCSAADACAAVGSCPALASCTTAGYNVFGSAGATRALAEGWNGTNWAIEPTPEPIR